MFIELKIPSAIKKVFISDEHSASSYGIPVAVVDGEAYGKKDYLPIWPDDELSWLNAYADTTVSAACLEMQKEGLINQGEVEFIRKFYDEPWR